MAMSITAALGGLDVLINNASSLGPVPLVPLADTACEELQEALDTNLVGPFRLTKALLGSLATSAREGGHPAVINVTSDAAESAYAGWGAYGASKAGLAHLGRIWDEELKPHGIRVLNLDPGDMDTPLHAAALPGADPTQLKAPADSAAEIVEAIAELQAGWRRTRGWLPERTDDRSSGRQGSGSPGQAAASAGCRRCDGWGD